MAGKKKEEIKESPIGEVIKKVVSIGVGAAFLTEDAVKNILSDLPLPKDIISGLVQNAKGAKKDFTDSVRDEIKDYLSNIDLKKVIENTLDEYDFEIKADIKLKRKKGRKSSR